MSTSFTECEDVDLIFTFHQIYIITILIANCDVYKVTCVFICTLLIAEFTDDHSTVCPTALQIECIDSCILEVTIICFFVTSFICTNYFQIIVNNHFRIDYFTCTVEQLYRQNIAILVRTFTLSQYFRHEDILRCILRSQVTYLYYIIVSTRNTFPFQDSCCTVDITVYHRLQYRKFISNSRFSSNCQIIR